MIEDPQQPQDASAKYYAHENSPTAIISSTGGNGRSLNGHMPRWIIIPRAILSWSPRTQDAQG